MNFFQSMRSSKTARQYFLGTASVLASSLLLNMAGQVSAMAQATPYPTKSITMIVPFPPGGLADIVARPVAEAMSRELGQSVIIENKGGAGGGIGMGVAARSKPDGYTVLLPLADRELGALTLVDTLSRGEALPPQGAAIALKDVRLRAPLPHPRRNIFCVGKNYHAHAKEFARSGFDSSAKAGGEIPAEPIIFTKVPECVIATGEAIEMPKVSTAIDYEAELAVIIGKGGKGITKANAMSLTMV